MNELKIKILADPGNTPETEQFKTWLVDLFAQAIRSFSDGASIGDAPDFFDELMASGTAIKGLAEGLPKEAENATPEDVEKLFAGVQSQLTNAGLNTMLAGAIVSNLKGLYYVFATLKQKKEDAVIVVSEKGKEKK